MKAISTLCLKSLIAVICILSAATATAQCSNAPTLKFFSPVLISGTDKQPGAVYRFANVAPGLDAHITVTALHGGAVLYNIDDSAGIGYYDAFQPYVGAAANDTSFIDWKITFKKGGTDTDSMLPCLAVTGVDVDGDAAYLKEFIEAATPGSISVDPFTNLTVSFDGVRSKAISPIANVALIDTNHREAMFQMNFQNITTLDYRNGAISTYGSQQIRQTCIYFKPFFQTYFLLPVKLLSFTARTIKQTTELRWSATDEASLHHYTIQRSSDGRSWKNIGDIAVLPERSINNYVANDFEGPRGVVYYRLMKVSKNGKTDYSSIVKIDPNLTAANNFKHNTFFMNSIKIQGTYEANETYSAELYSISGHLITRSNKNFHAGSNTMDISVPSSVAPGIYVLTIKDSKGKEVYRSKLVRNG